MRFTLKELAELVGGTPQGDAAKVVTGVAGLEEAGADDVTFLADAKRAAELGKTRAGAVIVPEGLPADGAGPSSSSDSGPSAAPSGRGGQARIAVAKPQLAFNKILAVLERERRKLPKGIHPSAVIHPNATLEAGVAVGALAVIEEGAQIGPGTVIYAQAYVGAETVIGRDCLIYPQVVIRERCVLGDRVILHPGVVIGADGYGFTQDGGVHHKIPQVGRVVIEDDVELGAQTCVDRATMGETRVGAGTKTDNYVQIAHNAKVGKHCLMVCQAGISGSSTMGDYVVLAGNSAISDHVTVGDRVVVLAKSGVTKDLPAGAVYSGMPARPVREYLKTQALVAKLQDLFNDVKELKKTAAGSK